MAADDAPEGPNAESGGTQSYHAPADGLSDTPHPDRVGPYRILQVLGEGGMGVVYLAEQEQPVRRRVALKIIKLGMDTKAVVARFEAERQALALMNHPNIAKVHDAGTTKVGRPYFVMEHVPGVPITEHCDRQRLTTRERMELFMQLCDAVQHAHQKGIIHRDLKPSNVLVTDQDGQRVPKIIDFGVAKATNQRLTEQTVYTELGQIIGTPEYMSPEQAEMTAEDIDTRSDIYSLGVLLYELLAGALPFDSKTLRRASYAEIQRTIREVEPPKPSTKVSTLGEEATAIAEHRQIDVRALTRQLHGDLDWITMKALAKDRTRRYANASELAADIRRHLNHEPVLASPPSPTYRLGKFLRKNKGPVSAAALVLVVLIAGLVVSLILYHLAQSRYDEILRLSDIKHLDDLTAEAETLWPCIPDKVPAMKAWLAKVRQLAERLDEHRATLAIWRRGAVSSSGTAWTFADTQTRWRHDVLAQLVDGLEKLREPTKGLVADIEKRFQFASTVYQKSVQDHRKVWDHAIASIANLEECPKYKGLNIKAQLGLVPIGRDSESGLWEFAHLQTGSIPTRDGDGKLILTEETGLVFVLIPGGTFSMGAVKPSDDKPEGSPNVDPEAEKDQRPVHEVTLDPFFLSKYEMTQGQWSRFTGNRPSMYHPDRKWGGKEHSLMHPVENVSWNDCQGVLARLDIVLPTEAQWEYAARAGTLTVWWTGNEKESISGAANLADFYCKNNGGPSTWNYEEWLDDGYLAHAPVGSYTANPFALHDVIGNVWEWCRDGHGSYRYDVEPGSGQRQVKGARHRVFRGGSWCLTATSARSARRLDRTPEYHDRDLGCRPARKITE